MDPATGAALVTVALKLLDHFEKRGGQGDMSPELLAAREVLRKGIVERAKAPRRFFGLVAGKE